MQTLFLHSILLTNLSLFNMDAVFFNIFLNCVESSKLHYIISISIFAFIYMNCTGKMAVVGSWKVGNFINGKIEEKKFE